MQRLTWDVTLQRLLLAVNNPGEAAIVCYTAGVTIGCYPGQAAIGCYLAEAAIICYLAEAACY